MKKSKLLIVLIMCLFVSCAHKSGHKRLNRSAESATERESVRTPDSEDNVTPATAEYGDNNEILNGKTIFNYCCPIKPENSDNPLACACA